MRKLENFIKESEELEIKDFPDELRSLIQKSLKTSDSKTIEDFIEAYKKDPLENDIEGLINDADIYDTYLKYRDDIDEILSSDDFFKKSSEELNVFSLYDYVIVGTKKAIEKAVSELAPKKKENVVENFVIRF